MRCVLFFLCMAASYSVEAKYNNNALLKNTGTVQSVYDLLDRSLPGSKAHFLLSITPNTNGDYKVSLSDEVDGKVKIDATTASELAFGVGHYFREYCNMTIGWKRGGGSNLFIPKFWPVVGGAVTKKRVVPWSYMMNVCTHSYSLVWYNWDDWQEFIDWMAMSGINLFLASTGQEEIQYKVLTQFGLSDIDIRSWFNGPAFLTWSRISNEYGNDIAGPLPRSWMKSQHALQLKIVKRYRSLGMSGQLPGFQGNVPIQFKAVHADTNITQQGDTGWMDSLDPFYAKIADIWMKTMLADFGTDHWYQLDGYFNGGTAPWLAAAGAADGAVGGGEATFSSPLPSSSSSSSTSTSSLSSNLQLHDAEPDAEESSSSKVACTWSGEEQGFIANPACHPCKVWPAAKDAREMCASNSRCGGITSTKEQNGGWVLRTGTTVLNSTAGEQSYLITNDAACHPYEPIVTDPMWIKRGVAAYTGLNRTDPEAIWSFQGWVRLTITKHCPTGV